MGTTFNGTHLEVNRLFRSDGNSASIGGGNWVSASVENMEKVQA